MIIKKITTITAIYCQTEIIINIIFITIANRTATLLNAKIHHTQFIWEYSRHLKEISVLTIDDVPSITILRQHK